MKSMTGYGSGEFSNDVLFFNIGIKSVNNRYLDIGVKLPRNLLYLEDRIRKEIKSKIYRGKVDVFVNFKYINSVNDKIEVDLSLAKEYYNALHRLKDYLSIEGNISLKDIYLMDGVFNSVSEKEDEDTMWGYCKIALGNALEDFVSMRNTEGENLLKSFSENLSYIRDEYNKILELAPTSLMENKATLEEKIKSNISEDKLDLQRLTTELIIMADRLSIDEELVRLNSHIDQFNDIMNIVDEPIGRKLDFLTQELNREVNTIGSKSTNLNIQKSVVELKSYIEKLREQIQNIE